MPRRARERRPGKREPELTIFVRDETRPLCILLSLALPALAILIAWPFLAEPRLRWPEWAFAWWTSFAVGCAIFIHVYPLLAMAHDSLLGRALSMRAWPWPLASLMAALLGLHLGWHLARGWLLPVLAPKAAAALQGAPYSADAVLLYQVGQVAVAGGLQHGLLISFALAANYLALGTIYKVRGGHRLVTVDLYRRGKREPVERVSLLLRREEAERVRELLPLRLQGVWPRKALPHIAPMALHLLATCLAVALATACLQAVFTCLILAGWPG